MHPRRVTRRVPSGRFTALVAIAVVGVVAMGGCSAPYDAVSAAGSPAVVAEMTYIDAHWNSRNTAEFGSLGGDCVNFTSQALLARGWPMDDTWWHTNTAGSSDYSSAWVSSTALLHYLEKHPTLAVQHRADDTADIVVGDIIQFDWDNSGDRDHTAIVSRVTGTGADRQIFAAEHTPDAYLSSVETIITKNHPGADVYYWHLADPTA
ncbi:amidase domain-containing protein [Glaciihabitans sp. dw_435]|uniref:amidase domain-containing protein n=1 Tax=Glaciihabitans sp. dw_435 TaxID=2720081 RepID=UPI001BD5F7E5|nr:amidase domain-containing protein [Glaciihabitans sp. dw_435]